MAETDTKVNPPEQAESAAEPKLDKEPTEKATTGEVEGNKSTTETVTDNASSAPSAVKDKVFSMFGGGPKREKKEEPEDVDEPSGSSKAKKEEAETDDHPEEHEPDAEFKPVVHLTKKVETKTHEEGEELFFRIQKAKLFRFDREAREWKERGTGEVKLLKHVENGKIRLLMRREKTLKVCANHYVVPEMNLMPNVGSARSWVWNAVADMSEGEPEAQTLAIRLADPDQANLFKEAFIKAQQENEKYFKEEK